MELLAPDVTVWSDGGGKVRAARVPVTGARKVAAWLATWSTRPYEGVSFEEMSIRITEINGMPGVLALAPDRVLGVLTVELDETGRIAAIHAVGNPDKLVAVTEGRVHQLS
jgi:RNA polymerase sigma-70 factor (ECF subfamily)